MTFSVSHHHTGSLGQRLVRGLYAILSEKMGIRREAGDFCELARFPALSFFFVWRSGPPTSRCITFPLFSSRNQSKTKEVTYEKENLAHHTKEKNSAHHTAHVGNSRGIPILEISVGNAI
jgi:hypothetical protein